MEEIIKVENIRKTFNDNVEILKGISFSVEKGEVLSIIGPSGSGKTTMLRCISQLETVSDGTISICGKTLVKNGIYADKKDRHDIILKSGLVFQNFNLFPHYSVLKNVVDPQVQVLKKTKEDAVQDHHFSSPDDRFQICSCGRHRSLPAILDSLSCDWL